MVPCLIKHGHHVDFFLERWALREEWSKVYPEASRLREQLALGLILVSVSWKFPSGFQAGKSGAFYGLVPGGCQGGLRMCALMALELSSDWGSAAVKLKSYADE
jgi:hypothetical protein